MKFSFLLFFVVLVLVGQVAASNMLVYGYARVDGELAPVGAVVSAVVVDSVVGNCSVGEEGMFGVFVVADRLEHTPIEFYIGEVKAIQVVPFVPGGVMQIDLDFRSPVEETVMQTTTSTFFKPPAAAGRAVSVTVGDTAAYLMIVFVFLVVVYSIQDILK